MTARARTGWRTLRGLILLAVALYVMLRWFEYKQVYHPHRDWVANANALGRPWESVWLKTSDGLSLSAWYFPARNNSPRGELAFLVCHGNGGNISHRLDLAHALLSTGANVLLFDYRGYGRSEGRPTEAGTYLDAQAAHAWLMSRGFAATNLLVLGESLGGAVATELARRETIGGLVLQSTFTSLVEIGSELFPFLPVRWIATIQYDTLGKLPEIRVPVLFLHSRADGLVPFHHAERNFAAANQPKQLWEIAGDHNDALEADPARYVAGIEAFLARHGRAAPVAPALP